MAPINNSVANNMVEVGQPDSFLSGSRSDGFLEELLTIFSLVLTTSLLFSGAGMRCSLIGFTK